MNIATVWLYFSRSNLIGEVCVLEDMTSHLPVIEIRIEECRGKTCAAMKEKARHMIVHLNS